jgi:UDP-glucose 4-epimerase
MISSADQLPQSQTGFSSMDTGLGLNTPPHTPQLADSTTWGAEVHGQSDPFDDGPTPSNTGGAPTLPGSRLHLDAASQDYVMVIGGLGYIGSHTTLELMKEGLNVIIVDDLSNSYLDVLARIRTLAEKHCKSNGMVQPQLLFHNLDYRSVEMNVLLHRYASSQPKITGVIHFAAFKSVSDSIGRPLAYYRNNISGLIDLLVIMQDVGIKNFVFSSSATVYGEEANAGKPLHEDNLIHFNKTITDADGKVITYLNGARGLTSPYGRTKYFAEAILADVARADPLMRITALRYFNPVGCHPSGILREDPRVKPTNLFPVIASVMAGSKEELEVFGTDWPTRDGTAIRDFIHVMDLAQGHVAAFFAASPAVSPNRDAFRAYNLGSGTGMTVAEVVSSFEKAANLKIPVVLASRREGDVGFCVAATARAELELGWKTTKRVDECARDTWRALTMVDHLQ